MRKANSDFCLISVVAIQHIAALIYSCNIRYIVNRVPVTIERKNKTW